MTGKKFKMIVAFTLVFVVLVQMALPLSANAATSINELNEKYSDLKEQQAELKKKIAESKKKIENQEEHKEQLDKQISVVQEQISNLNDRITLLDSQIESKTAEIADRESDIQDTEEQLKQRLRALYVTGDPSGLALILSAESVSDLFDKSDAMRRISEHDRLLVEQLRESQAAIETERESIQTDRSEVAETRKEASKKESELAALIDESNSVIQSLQSVEKAAEEEEEQVSKDMASVDKEINAWFAEYERQKAKKNSTKSDNGSSKSSDSGSKNSGGSDDSNPYVTIDFAWPVPGFYKVTSPFGPRWGRMHNGIDIAGSGVYGHNIVAAAAGTVVHVVTYNNSGYGYYLIIDHGNGYSTLYGHCSSISVSKGQTVSRGQVVAKVGNTGRSTGPHLHFEIRVNGVAKNPMNWFK